MHGKYIVPQLRKKPCADSVPAHSDVLVRTHAPVFKGCVDDNMDGSPTGSNPAFEAFIAGLAKEKPVLPPVPEEIVHSPVCMLNDRSLIFHYDDMVEKNPTVFLELLRIGKITVDASVESRLVSRANEIICQRGDKSRVLYGTFTMGCVAAPKLNLVPIGLAFPEVEKIYETQVVELGKDESRVVQVHDFSSVDLPNLTIFDQAKGPVFSLLEGEMNFRIVSDQHIDIDHVSEIDPVRQSYIIQLLSKFSDKIDPNGSVSEVSNQSKIFDSDTGLIVRPDRKDAMPYNCFSKLVASGYRDGRFSNAVPASPFLIEFIEYSQYTGVFRFHEISTRKTTTYVVRYYLSSNFEDVLSLVIYQHRKGKAKYRIKSNLIFNSFIDLPEITKDFEVSLTDEFYPQRLQTAMKDESRDFRRSRKYYRKYKKDRPELAYAYLNRMYTDVESNALIWELSNDVRYVKMLNQIGNPDYLSWCTLTSYREEVHAGVYEISQMYLHFGKELKGLIPDIEEDYGMQSPYWFRFGIEIEELLRYDDNGCPVMFKDCYDWILGNVDIDEEEGLFSNRGILNEEV